MATAKKKSASTKRSTTATRKRGGAGGGGGTRGAKTTTDHDEIRRWAESRGATPACVRGTGGAADPGMIRLDFPGYSGAESLVAIDWGRWFEAFEQNKLALVYQETTAGGDPSNFNKLVGRTGGRARGGAGATRGKRAGGGGRASAAKKAGGGRAAGAKKAGGGSRRKPPSRAAAAKGGRKSAGGGKRNRGGGRGRNR